MREKNKPSRVASVKPTDGQRDRESEEQSFRSPGVPDDTHEPDEFPPLSACVSTLQVAAQMALADQSSGDPIFRFARALKAFEITVDARLPEKELPTAFAIWWSLAKDTLPPETNRDECFFLFMDAYEKAKTPLGANVIQTALARVEKTPLPPEARKYESPKIQRLVHLCYELQSLVGDNPFFLSVRDAARAIGCTGYQNAGVFLNGLVRDGILDPVERGKPGGHRASRFRYVSGSHPCRRKN